jgi:hypothetical protein
VDIFHGMSRFTLEVVEPHPRAPLGSDEEPLESALDAVATVHGGMVVGSSTNTGKSSARHYVNIFDCEDSLEDEVRWLRKRFPRVRFTLKEFM